MMQSNAEAARCVYANGASACTDVTGFGLVGHLLEMQREPTSSVKEEVPSEPTSEVLVDPGQNNSARVSHEVPAEASGGRQRRQQFNRRRQADPLGEGHACTWRLMLIKVAARIQVTARRVRVLLSGCWPFLPFFRDVGRTLVGDS